VGSGLLQILSCILYIFCVLCLCVCYFVSAAVNTNITVVADQLSLI
jgi:hypothetical protein